MLPVSSDPTLAAQFRQATTLTRADGTTVRVGPKTRCTARAVDETTMWVETFVPEPTSLWRRLRGDVPMRRGVLGHVPAADVVVRRHTAYVPVTQPIFPHQPRLDDVVQKGFGRVSTLAACTVAIVQQEPFRITQLFVDHEDGTVTVQLHPQPVRIHKTLPRHPKDGAVWWRFLQKAIAAQGWPRDGSHTATCPGGDCATFIRMLTGHRPQTHELRFNDFDYVNAMVDRARDAAAQLELIVPHGIPRDPAPIVEQYLAKTMVMKLRNQGIVCMTTHASLPATAIGITQDHSYAVLWVREHHGSYDLQLRDPRTGQDVWMSLRSFLSVASALYFAELRVVTGKARERGAARARPDHP